MSLFYKQKTCQVEAHDYTSKNRFEVFADDAVEGEEEAVDLDFPDLVRPLNGCGNPNSVKS